MLNFVCIVTVNKTRKSRSMSMNIRIHKQSTISLLIELSKFILLIILIFEITDE